MQLVIGGTAGEWPLGNVAPQILFPRAVGAVVECFSVRRPVERAKRDHASWKHDGLRPLSGGGVDRDADRVAVVLSGGAILFSLKPQDTGSAPRHLNAPRVK